MASHLAFQVFSLEWMLMISKSLSKCMRGWQNEWHDKLFRVSWQNNRVHIAAIQNI